MTCRAAAVIVAMLSFTLTPAYAAGANARPPALPSVPLATTVNASDEHEDDPEPILALHEHGGLAPSVERSGHVGPDGFRYAELWFGGDFVLRVARMEMSCGPGIAQHVVASAHGGPSTLSSGPGAHLELATDLADALPMPLFVRFEAQAFTHGTLGQAGIRGVFAIALRFR